MRIRNLIATSALTNKEQRKSNTIASYENYIPQE